MSLPGSSGSAALYSVAFLEKNERKQISLHYVFIRPTLGAGRPGSASPVPRPALPSSPPRLSRQPEPANSCSHRLPAPCRRSPRGDRDAPEGRRSRTGWGTGSSTPPSLCESLLGFGWALACWVLPRTSEWGDQMGSAPPSLPAAPAAARAGAKGGVCPMHREKGLISTIHRGKGLVCPTHRGKALMCPMHRGKKGSFAPCTGGNAFICPVHRGKGLICPMHRGKKGSFAPRTGKKGHLPHAQGKRAHFHYDQGKRACLPHAQGERARLPHAQGKRAQFHRAQGKRAHLPHAQRKRAHLPHGQGEEGSFAPCTGQRRGQRALATPLEEEEAPRGPNETPTPSFPRCRPAQSSCLFSREETGNLAIIFFFSFLFFFGLFFPPVHVWRVGATREVPVSRRGGTTMPATARSARGRIV